MQKPANGSSSRTPYLQFVIDTFEQLLAHQSARLRGCPEGTLFITVSNRTGKTYRSLGVRQGNTYQTYLFPAPPIEMQPRRADLTIWPLMRQLSRLTGQERYTRLADDMARAFPANGFEPRSGLGYLGEEADFDVVHLCGQPLGSYPEPKFKPGNSGALPGLPLDDLWQHAPRQMTRMCRSMFYGLITDARTMDYNRFCYYNFEDTLQEPSMPKDRGHLAFGSAGARMIHWWCSAFARTDDRQFLEWSQRMADKWQAVQHPVSGLMPEYFGGSLGQGTDMPPSPYANARSASMAATALMDAVGELSRGKGSEALAEQLTDMARRMHRGIACHSYDPTRRVFREYLHLDGQPFERTTRYTFRTLAEKQKMVQVDPLMEEVPVFDGVGFYENGPYWSYCAGSDIPHQLALTACRTSDPDLIERCRTLATDIIDEAAKVRSALTAENQWTYHATGLYIKTLLLLARLTGDPEWIVSAQPMADQAMSHLAATTAESSWWRHRDRGVFLGALLQLDEELSLDRRQLRERHGEP